MTDTRWGSGIRPQGDEDMDMDMDDKDITIRHGQTGERETVTKPALVDTDLSLKTDNIKI